MKTAFSALLFCATPLTLFGQNLTTIPDTLINQPFDTDPAPFMLDFPSGDDLIWVNYDQDGGLTDCIDTPVPEPSAWFWESDLGFNDQQQTDNYAFTSCSYLTNPNLRNRNWLITEPVTIPDSSFWLCWRSLSYYGPGYLDGYKVLLSAGSNVPEANSFLDTIFAAAEMIEDSAPSGSLNPADYVFSNGYVHANGYTDTSYFFVDNTQGPSFLHGRLEPHIVSLAKYANKKIYIAFLHDSQDDFLLQVDDILVSKTHVSASTPQNVLWFNVLPNPARDVAYFSWKMKTPQEGRLSVTDNSGRVVLQKSFSNREEGRLFFEIQHLEPGIYCCTLETSAGRATTRLVKM